ncbi:hypothetical protein ACX12L_17180 [Alicycliphilus sp. T452]
MAATLVRGTIPSAWAQVTLKQEAAAQLKADERRLQRDDKPGRMAATSPVAEKVYQDQQAIKGQEKVIAADKASD